jgi:DNA uptake protein ComE-like DNA-binding protein
MKTAPSSTTTPSLLAVLFATLLFLLLLAGCAQRVEDSPAYQAACQGPPLHADMARRNQAMEDGYAINRVYDCIDKASFILINEQKARWEAANTPEARDQREAEHRQLMAEQLARARAARASDEQAQSTLPVPAIVPVDVNTATEAELAGIPPLDSNVAAQIVEQRLVRPFSNWGDLVARIAGLGAAQTAVYASIGGLQVNGESLSGAPPNAELAAQLRARYQRSR